MKNVSVYIVLFLVFILVQGNAFGQPANDACSNAISLGTLPAPAACTGATGVNVGTSVTQTGTTVGATPSSPYPYLSHCPINTAAPPNDVWYSFVASSNQVVVSISGSTMTNPVITVWSGACGTFTGMGCVTGAGGAATITIYQTVIGQTYYIQIAGSTVSENGTFTLTVHNDQDCNNCLTTSSLVASPAPVDGMYAPGTTVTFCYTVSKYVEQQDNWFHGVTPAFGSGWNMSTFTTVSLPASIDGHGTWGYYPTGVTSTATGTAWPAGYYYYSNEPNGLTGGPGNTYGDNCPSGNCTWQFCFSITTNSACSPGSNLGLVVSTSADGESGAWTSPGCASDPQSTFSATGACCPPIVASTPDTCGNGVATATATPIGTNGPWTYHWSAGTPATQTVNGPSTVTGLHTGTVTVTVTDHSNCTSTASINVIQISFAGPNQATSCVSSLPGGTVTMAALSTGTWSAMAGNPGTATIVCPTCENTVIDNFSAGGVYQFLYNRAGGCVDTAAVTVDTKPNAGGHSYIACVPSYPGGTTNMAATTSTAATWTAMAGNPGTATITTPTSGNTTITNFTASGTYNFIWTNTSGCSDTATITVTNKPNAGGKQTFSCVVLPLASVTMSAVGTGTWAALPGNPSTPTITSPTNPTTTITNFTAGGTYRFSWTNTNGCPDTATIYVNTVPNAPAASASPATICNGSSSSLTATSAGNNINWYSTATGGTALTTVASGTAYVVSPSATTTYYAEAQTIGGTFTQTYSYTGSAQTWTVPAGASSATVYIWGGGGGGGAADNASQTSGGGGGGGACGITTLSGLTSGSTYTITVGAGGTAGTGAGEAGNGGTTSISGPLGTWSINGGIGGFDNSTGGGGSASGLGGAGATTGSGSGLTVYDGGNGSNGVTTGDTIGQGGGGGGSSGAGAAGACAGAAAGGSGTYPGGTGGYDGNCGSTSGSNGVAGSAPGGGGSGAHQNNGGRTGGAGGAGQVIIVYTIPTCTSNTRTPVTVTVNAIPAATTVSGAGTFCNSAVLTATGGTGGTIYWQNSTSGGTSTTTPSTSQTVTASGTYYFNSDNNGCWGTQGSATITITAGPAAPTASASPATICAGASSALTATSAGNNINWWTAATGGTELTTTVSGGTYTVTPASTTTYYAESQALNTNVVTVTASGSWTVPAGVTSATVYLWGGGGGGGAARSGGTSGGGGGGGASGYATITGLTAGNSYTITIGAGGAGGTAGGTAAGTGGTTSFAGALGTWSVTGGAGGTSSTTTGAVAGGSGGSTGSGTGITTYAGGAGSTANSAGNIIGEGGGGGGSGGAGAAGAATCTGVAAAGGSGAYTGGTGGYNTNCGGNTANSTGTNGSSPGGGGSGAHDHNATESGGAGGAGQVIIVYTTNGCPSPTRTPVIVTVNTIPAAVTVSGGGTYCGSAALTATGGAGGTIYWENTTTNGTSTATAASTETLTTSGTYYFRAENACGWSAQGSATIFVNAKPNAGPDTIACQGGTANMHATPVLTGAWSAQSGNPGTATITTASNATTTITGFSTAGTYYFIWTNTLTGCTDTAAVVVSAGPGATISDNAPLCLGGNLTATATPTVGGTYTYHWSGPSSFSSTAASFTITSAGLANSGTYTLTLTNTANSCSASINTNLVVENCLTVSGSLFDDANGDGILDGTDVATDLGHTLYAILADTNNHVVSVSTIAANGSFTLNNILPNTSGYSVAVNTTAPAIGAASPGYTWPASWVGTQGQYGTNNLEGTGVDPVASELIRVAVASTSVTNMMIGFDRVPVTVPQTYLIPYPGINSQKKLVSTTGLGVLAGSDPEDGTYGTGSTFIISSLAGMNGNELFYDANADGILEPYEQITGYTVITNYNPSLLYVKFVGAGSLSATFTYIDQDAAGKVSQNSSNYTIQWVGTLPVKLLYFDAAAIGDTKSLLTWATASEQDNAYFDVQRSPDALNWSVIGQLLGAGTTDQQTNYSMTDDQPLTGTNYYRLKQVDVDGNFTYSDIAEVSFTSALQHNVSSSLSVYPNPLDQANTLNIELLSSDNSGNISDITITNAIGQIVYNISLSQVQNYQVTGLDLPSGMYMVSVRTDTNDKLSGKLIVTK